MDNLFFKVWRNKSILRIILNYLESYNKFYNKTIIFENINEIYKYKEIEYLRNIKILNNDDYDNNDSGINNKSIPWGIQSIEFGEDYSDEIKNDEFLPNSILNLKFGRSYNYRIQKYTLPESLTSIQFGNEYNYPIEKDKTFFKCFKNLKKIKFGIKFNQKINSEDLSNLINLKELYFGHYYSQSFEIASLPSTIEILEFGYQWNHSLSIDTTTSIGTCSVIPINCKSLIIMGLFNQPLNKFDLPNGLLKLHLGVNFNQTIDPNILPNSIQYLSFGYNFNNGNKILEKNVLPLNLKSLSFGGGFNSKINIDVLPNGLEELIFGQSFNQKLIKNSLPNSLTNLQFGESFNNNNGNSNITSLGIIPTNNLKKLIFKNQNFKINKSEFKNLNQDCEFKSYYFEVPKRTISDICFYTCYGVVKLSALLILGICTSIKGLFKKIFK